MDVLESVLLWKCTYLLVFDAGHEGRYVPLGFRLEGLHFLEELWYGCHLDTVVDLKVKEPGALESMVLVAYASGRTEVFGNVIPIQYEGGDLNT